jgi:hypothetical protein
MRYQVRAMLVYQAGIANVFKVDRIGITEGGRGRTERLYQGDFHTAVAFVRGMIAAGANVATAACNQAGDISGAKWTWDLESQPFADQLVNVFTA